MFAEQTPILIASGNKNKIAELQTLAREFGLDLISPTEAVSRFSLVSPEPDVDETGSTYHENALLKARAYCRWAGIPALGDDSGLEIFALDGRPGLHSARYAGPGATAAMRNEKVLKELAELERSNAKLNRSARYVCYLALVFPEGREMFADATLSGRILHEPVAADGGFGYDPIVYIDDFGKTFSEVDFAVTCSRGFRALAAKKLFAALVR